ncbi:MAG: methionyl-tRNA formyltransferase [Chloroflexi bacterium]|nr:methionyl-tRNA formyltransferase [Chloroflexota bacterium]
MPESPAGEARLAARVWPAASAAWIDAAWGRLAAKPEFSLRPRPRPAPPVPDGRASRAGAPPRVVVFGISSDYGNGLLLHLLRLGCAPVALITSTRLHHSADATLFAHAAAALDVPYLALADVNAPEALERLRALQPDVFLVFSFDQIFEPRTLALPRHGCVNFHPSLLPRFRGPEPLFWQVLLGERESGLTAHLMSERIDAGPILGQVRVPVQADDTAGRLARRIVLAAEPLLGDVLRMCAAGELGGTPPELAHGSYQRSASSTALDWRRPATELERLVRAGRPDAPAHLVWRGARYDVLSCRVVPGAGTPGVVLAVTKEGAVVATGEQCLLLAEVATLRVESAEGGTLGLRVGDDLAGSSEGEPRDGLPPPRVR